jgi:hypothetical protein
MSRLPGSPTIALAALALLAGPLAREARAEEPAPPAGWEEAPPLASPAPSRLPACCGFDRDCCQRQVTLNQTRPDRVVRVVEVRVEDLPELVVHEADLTGPGHAVPPPVRIVDGLGRPAPWPDGPSAEVRITPPGRFGEVRWGDFWTPFFADADMRSLGYGMAHFVYGHAEDRGRSILRGAVEFFTIGQGQGDTLAVDFVRGDLEGTPELQARRWAHADAAPISGGFIHAYREPGSASGDGERVVFVLPEAILGFEARDAKVNGGFIPSRFSRTEAYTTLTLPVDPGRSGLASFRLFGFQLRRWFPLPDGFPEYDRRIEATVSASRTLAEAEPRVRVVFFEG